MSSTLDPTIEDFLSTFEETSRKELTFVNNTDWTLVESRKSRISQHDLQDLLTDRNISHAEKLFALCKGDTKHPRVKNTLSMLIEFFKTYEIRKDIYFQTQDWTTFLETGEGEESDMRAEIEFQSKILGNVAKYKEKLRKINYGEDSVVIDLPVHGNLPVPLMMSSIIEERYPEIKEFLEKRRELFYGTPTPKNVKKKTTKKKNT